VLFFPIEEMKELSGGKGVILMALEGQEKLVSALAVEDCVTIKGIGRGDKQAELQICASTADIYVGKRARKGKPVQTKFKRVLGMA
jgi:topoisomerase-4 subunit A